MSARIRYRSHRKHNTHRHRWLVALAVFGLPTISSADERVAELGQHRGDPIPVVGAQPGPVAQSGSVIFVNFDGAELSGGVDDATQNVTQIADLVGTFAPYGDGSKRSAVMQAVHADWAPYGVMLTDDRPSSGAYTMNMVGPTNPFDDDRLGVAPLDCNDAQTFSNITFAFHSADDGFSAAITATTISQEIAHSYGLEHVNEPGDIMNPYNAGGDPGFTDDCLPLSDTPLCPSQHEAECGTDDEQNAHRELVARFGSASPDESPPDVEIVSPADGWQFAIGTDFTIEVEVSDEVGVRELVLFNNGEMVQADDTEPWGWDITTVPEGEYELYVEASDFAGNVGYSNVVNVVVTENPVNPEAQDGDDDDDDDDDGMDPGTIPGGFGMTPRRVDDGCACASARVGDGGWAPTWLSVLFLLATVHRRSRHMRRQSR